MIVGHRGVDKVVEGGELVDVAPDGLVRRVEDVRAVLVDVDALHLFRVAVAADVGALVHHKTALSLPFGLIGEDGAEEAGSYYEIIIFHIKYHLYFCGENTVGTHLAVATE